MPIHFVFALTVFGTASNFASRILLALFAVRLGASPLMVGVLGAVLMCGFSQVFFNVSTQNLTGLHSTPRSRRRSDVQAVDV